MICPRLVEYTLKNPWIRRYKRPSGASWTLFTPKPPKYYLSGNEWDIDKWVYLPLSEIPQEKTIYWKSWYFLQMEVFKKFQIGYSNLLFRIAFYEKRTWMHNALFYKLRKTNWLQPLFQEFIEYLCVKGFRHFICYHIIDNNGNAENAEKCRKICLWRLQL